MDYRAIIVDFDRTLLHTDKTISAYTIRVLQKWQEAGTRLFAATARPERAIGAYRETISFDAVTTLNGARTITREAVIENPIGRESAETILGQLIRVPGMVISIETDDGLYANTDIPEWMPAVTDDIRETARKKKVYKILASHPEIRVSEIAMDLPDDTYSTVAEQKLLQYMSRSATKWNGVRDMLDAYRIDAARAVYFGDDNDDLEPIRRCGCGVAVSNALECVREAANHVTRSNDEDGVAVFLEERLRERQTGEQIRFLEEIASNGHVALNVMQYDGWLMRFSSGYTGRANSVSVLYPSTRDTAEKVAYCETCYAKQGLPALFKITDSDPELYGYLLKRGYSVVTPTDVMILDMDEPDPQADMDGCVFSAGPEEWLPVYFRLEEQTDTAKQDLFRRMVAKVLADTVYCTVIREGKAVACASAAIEQGYMLLQNVIVDRAARKTGLGEKLCRAILEKGRELGARHAYLQVVQTNTAAMNLYRKLGFRKAYTYRYLKQPPANREPGNPDKKAKTVIETERLLLREYTPDDFDALYEILSDPETMKHYPAPFDAAKTRRWITWNLDNYAQYGFGLWAVVLKETGAFIGDCGITIQNIDGELLPEIGYHIHKTCWRRGYAKEAARAVRDWGFRNTEYDTFYTYMKYTNEGSWRTALANGMKKIKEYADPKNEVSYVFAITREEWEKTAGL